MDAGVIGLLMVLAVIGVALYFARPRKVLPLDELLARLASIHNDPQLTSTQKLHLAEIAYRGFSGYAVSLVGGVQDVFPNNAVVMKTSSHELPLVGVELARVTPEELRAFNKGKAVTLRVRLPGWERYVSVVALPAGFRDAKLFYGGRWYGVKSTYRVRDPSEPKTGEFRAAAQRTGTFPALPKNPRSGEFPALPTSQKTGEFKALDPDHHKRNQ
ncbi:MAG: hypothetical protein ACRES8_09890 [Nevskiaceae bacterium]